MSDWRDSLPPRLTPEEIEQRRKHDCFRRLIRNLRVQHEAEVAAKEAKKKARKS